MAMYLIDWIVWLLFLIIRFNEAIGWTWVFIRIDARFIRWSVFDGIAVVKKSLLRITAHNFNMRIIFIGHHRWNVTVFTWLTTFKQAHNLKKIRARRITLFNHIHRHRDTDSRFLFRLTILSIDLWCCWTGESIICAQFTAERYVSSILFAHIKFTCRKKRKN